MTIRVQSGGEQTTEYVSDTATVQTLIDEGLVSPVSQATILVNGVTATPAYQLREGDVVTQLPLQGKQAS
jgi:hypothetical protein